MTPWWKTAVLYQIYPRSFADTDGDGIGDLEGVRRHLDHVVDLGADGIWLSPFYRSPMADFGYDVSDYCDVDPVFGTLDDIDRLIADAHERDLKVVVDWVPNHSSDQHPWFVEARSSRDSATRDWYIWRDPAPDGGPPNNWIRSWSDQPAWTLDAASGQYYLHCFLPQQPDLNWANPDLRAAMADTLRFWLDRGVDGFRMDVVHLIGKDPLLPDDPSDLAGLSHVPLNHRPETHAYLRDIRVLLDGYPGDRMAVGEVYLLDTADVATYYGDHDELHLNFNFPPLHARWRADSWHRQIARAEREHGPLDAWPTWVLSNHDNPRHRTRYGSEARARAAAVLLLTLRGTPFLYAGEELGLEDAVVAPDRVVDPGGRDGCRAPYPWDPTPEHGWLTDDPWLPWPPDADTRDARTQRRDPTSILALYRRVLAARRASPALHRGALVLAEPPDGVVAFERCDGDDRRWVLVNFTDAGVDVAGLTEAAAAGAELEVEVSTHLAHEGAAFAGALDPDEAVILRAREGLNRAVVDLSIALLIGLSFVTALIGTLGGLGGAIILVPVLVLLGVEPQFVAPLGILSVAAGSLAAAPRHLDDGVVHHRLGVTLEITATAGAIVGALLGGLVSSTVLSRVLAVVAILAAISGVRRRGLRNLPQAEFSLEEPGEWPGTLSGAYRLSPTEIVPYSAKRVPVGLVAMLAAGVVSGLAGIGGGFIKTPAMNQVMSVPVRVAAATSTFTVGITAAASLLVFSGQGRIDYRAGAAIVVGGVVGGTVGARVGRHLHPELTRRILTVLLALIALVLVVSG